MSKEEDAYATQISLVKELTAHLNQDEKDDVFYQTAINIFCEKTTVLAEKVFHLAAGEAQLNFCHMLKFTLSSRIVISSFVIEIFKKTLPLAEAKCVFRYRYVLKTPLS